MSLPRAFYTLNEFCDRNAISRRQTYREINAGRLVIVKRGRRTLIPVAAEKAWQEEIFCTHARTRVFGDQCALARGGGWTYLRKLLEHFGDKPLSQIGQAEIDAAAVALYPNGSAATRNRSVHTPISAILRGAGEARQLRRPRGSAGNKTTAWLWPEQAEASREEDGMKDPHFEYAVVIPAASGWEVAIFIAPGEHCAGGEFSYEPIIAWEISRWESPYHSSVGRPGEFCTHREVTPITAGNDLDNTANRWAIKRPNGTFEIPFDCSLPNEREALAYLFDEWKREKARVESVGKDNRSAIQQHQGNRPKSVI